MKVGFTPEGEPRNLQRHRIRFHTEADFKKAFLLHKKQGFIAFRRGGPWLIGKIILVDPVKLAFEIDAAVETAKDQP